ncbi:hypothetical protein LBMAG53_01050 [Planctomycetota bacterium]|nr:hypothetical protein LBMAG53_01050 [Planctomycetota bacterium]
MQTASPPKTYRSPQPQSVAPPRPDPLIGKTFGSVRLTEKLGSGAMGTVYRAWHDRFAQEVAVKLLKGGNTGTARERFLREGRAAAKIKHPNVTRVMDAGEIHGAAYLVMELVDGHSLGSILDDQVAKGAAGLSPESVRALGIGISRGLAAIHAQGIVHRDIKPDNILVGKDGTPKITDLGLAKQLDDPELLRLTGTGMVVGTPLYVSPEGIRDPQRIGPKSDVYGLGCTLFHLLTGQPPYPGSSAYDVMRGHLEQPVPQVRSSRNPIPSDLAVLVERCLSKQPDRRPSADDLADLLERGGATRGGRWALPAVIAAVIAVVLGGAAGAWSLLDASPAAAAEAPSSALIIAANAPAVEIRLDSGPWKPLPDGGVVPATGKVALAVRAAASGPGALRAWRGTVDLAEGERRKLDVVLDRITVPAIRQAVSGSGMLHRNGEPVGLDRETVLDAAGSWHLGRCGGKVWTSRIVLIDLDGTAAAGPEEILDHPSGPAFFRFAGDAPPHLVVSWWLADQARQVAQLPEPAGWSRQALRPEQPAVGLNPALLDAVLAFCGNRVRLPDPAGAKRLAVLHQAAAVWCGDGERKDVIGGAANTAIAAVVPSSSGP